MGTGGELLARIFHATASIKKSEDQPERTCDFRTRVARCFLADDGILEYLL